MYIINWALWVAVVCGCCVVLTLCHRGISICPSVEPLGHVRFRHICAMMRTTILHSPHVERIWSWPQEWKQKNARRYKNNNNHNITKHKTIRERVRKEEMSWLNNGKLKWKVNWMHFNRNNLLYFFLVLGKELWIAFRIWHRTTHRNKNKKRRLLFWKVYVVNP